MNVTFTSEAPAIDAPNTTITLDEDETKHDAAAVSPTTAEQVPPCAGVTKLAPPTVMVLDWYPASGVNVDAVGELSTVKKPAADAATLCGLAAPAVTIVTCTVEAPALVPVCMVIFAVVASTRVQSASAPPTKALHLAAASCADVTKLAPVTVIVLLTYPASGIAPVTLGGGRTTNPDFVH